MLEETDSNCFVFVLFLNECCAHHTPSVLRLLNYNKHVHHIYTCEIKIHELTSPSYPQDYFFKCTDSFPDLSEHTDQ